MLKDDDQEQFDRLQYVKIKHGRIAQLAFLGHIITRNGIHLPDGIDYSSDYCFILPQRMGGHIWPWCHPQGRALHHKETNKSNQMKEALLGDGIRARYGRPYVGEEWKNNH